MKKISHDPYLSSIDYYCHSGWIGHAPFLKFLIRELEPRIFVELGVHFGFSYFVGCQSIVECGLPTKAFAIDHWEGDSQAGLFDDSVYEEVEAHNLRYAKFSKLLRMNFLDALGTFLDHSIELLHFDGYHSYESVKGDFETWLPKMTNNGVVLFHDIHVYREGFGVSKFWNEISTIYKSVEFVGSHGLGVLFLGDIPHGDLLEIFNLSESKRISGVQGAFGSISDDVIQNYRVSSNSKILVERDIALTERDIALTERDIALTERQDILNSTIWKTFLPYRKIKLLFQRD